MNYHVNVAFITETPPVGWLYAKSGANDKLFSNPHGRRVTAPAVSAMHFVYGSGDNRGIPVFFIVPEDSKTRGMDGVRDYVQAHPTDFKDMSVSSNDAVERYSWFSDFLSSLSQGAIDPHLRSATRHRDCDGARCIARFGQRVLLHWSDVKRSGELRAEQLTLGAISNEYRCADAGAVFRRGCQCGDARSARSLHAADSWRFGRSSRKTAIKNTNTFRRHFD